jgi:hypothetical protein
MHARTQLDSPHYARFFAADKCSIAELYLKGTRLPLLTKVSQKFALKFMYQNRV